MRLLMLLLSTSIIFMGCEAFLGDSFKGDETVVMEPDIHMNYGSISGVLTDNVTSYPIAGATVTAFYSGGAKTTTTDSEGWWYLTDIPYKYFDTEPDGDGGSSGTDFRMVQIKYTHKNYQTDTATVELYGHVTSSIGRNVLRWTSNVIHHHTTSTMIETTSNYDQEDNVATKGYYLPNVGSNITVTFNMDMDRDWIGNSPFELFDADNNLVAISGSWSSATTFTIDPTSELTCTDKLDYHRLRVIR